MSVTVSADNPDTCPPPASPVQVVRRLLPDKAGEPPNRIIVLWAERRQFLKRRWKGVSEDGEEFGFDLEARLQDGGVIHRTAEADYIVKQLPELVYIIRPPSQDEAALAGWKIGNLHMPVQISAGEIRVQHDPAVRQLIEREGWIFEERELVFQPLRVAAHAT